MIAVLIPEMILRKVPRMRVNTVLIAVIAAGILPGAQAFGTVP
jgi:hypothetical protein